MLRTEKNAYDSKWGCFKPIEKLNFDQSPLPFVVHGKKTYEYIPAGEGSSPQHMDFANRIRIR